MSKRLDLSSQRFGRLVALRPDKTYVKHSGKIVTTWTCRCDCGNEVVVSTSNLRSGNTKSCGCLQKDRASSASFIDLTGQRFGMLTVLNAMPNKNRFGHYEYKCRCDCGGLAIVDAANLRTGNTSSCGCIKSYGENYINKWLQEHSVNFRPQYSHDKIIYPSGRRPFFDFAVFDNDDNLLCLIEYNGEQHYVPGYGWNDEENHIITVKRDEEKRKQCKRFGIKLHEIPYWDYENLDSILTRIINEATAPDIEEAQEELTE